MIRRARLVTVLFLTATLLAACGGDAGQDAQTNTAPAEETTTVPSPTALSITARDYAFDVPASIRGGLVSITYSNVGKEPHFAGFARIAPGKTFGDVRAALLAPPPSSPPSAPPAAPPPFEDVGGLAVADPGTGAQMTLNLPAGGYAFYCLIPSPDGVSHAAKGMISQVSVTEGTEGPLPASVGTVRAVDFGLVPVPPLKAGSNVVRLQNEGKQLHELNLVEVATGRTMDDVVAWHRRPPSGPPPFRFLSGPAIKPGSDATADLKLETGKTYAFICAVPDFLSDFAPHITKGMYTSAFTVR